jgi:hypothetical protein
MPKLLLALIIGLPVAASLAAIGSLSHTRSEYFGVVHAYPATSDPRGEVEESDVERDQPSARPVQVAEHGC